MGFFGGLFRVAKGLVGAGLSQATGGLSNQLFSLVGQKKRQKYLTNMEQAELAKVRVPRVKLTTRTIGPTMDWGGTMETYGESVGERAERKRRQRLANLAKARAARRKKDI